MMRNGLFLRLEDSCQAQGSWAHQQEHSGYRRRGIWRRRRWRWAGRRREQWPSCLQAP